MSGYGRALQEVVGMVAQKKYHLLSREKIQSARADLNFLLKGVVGAGADNVSLAVCMSFEICLYFSVSPSV